MKPAYKTTAIEGFLSAVIGDSRKTAIEHDTCVMCGFRVRQDDFNDELSLTEFGISGLCQTCQDEMGME